MSDLIVTSVAGNVVQAIESPDTMVVTVDNGEVIVVRDAADLSILQTETIGRLVVEPTAVPRVEVLTAGAQGPAGRDGSAGDVTTLPAAGPISGHRVIAPTGDGRARYASSDTLADANNVLGISQSAVADGDSVMIQQGGLLTEPSWTWTPHAPIFCGVNGLLTQEPPASGFALIVATATTPTTISVGVKQPIIIS